LSSDYSLSGSMRIGIDLASVELLELSVKALGSLFLIETVSIENNLGPGSRDCRNTSKFRLVSGYGL
jgi:hypothetical protein